MKPTPRTILAYSFVALELLAFTALVVLLVLSVGYPGLGVQGRDALLCFFPGTAFFAVGLLALLVPQWWWFWVAGTIGAPMVVYFRTRHVPDLLCFLQFPFPIFVLLGLAVGLLNRAAAKELEKFREARKEQKQQSEEDAAP